MKFLKLFFTVIFSYSIGFTFAQSNAITPQLILKNQDSEPVISVRSKGTEGIRWGFEGGRVVKVGKTYHLFTSEMINDPIWTNMKLGYWRSTDGINWTRKATLKQGSGDFTGKDERAPLWSPLSASDEANNRWNLFYVAYKSEPSLPTNFLGNHAGRIWGCVSAVASINGIGGPYLDKAIILQPNKYAGAWEGLQGTDSFFPFKVGKFWYAFHGSAQTEFKPVKSFLVGMAKSSGFSLAGSWKRVPSLSPSKLESHFIENQIVTPAPGGGYLCVYDSEGDDAIGWAFSADGINWSKGNRLIIQPTAGKWAKDVRTPLGLIYEGGNRFTLFYTRFEQSPDWTRLLTGNGKETCAIGKVALILKS